MTAIQGMIARLQVLCLCFYIIFFRKKNSITLHLHHLHNPHASEIRQNLISHYHHLQHMHHLISIYYQTDLSSNNYYLPSATICYHLKTSAIQCRYMGIARRIHINMLRKPNFTFLRVLYAYIHMSMTNIIESNWETLLIIY